MNNFLSNQFHPLAPPNHLPAPPPNWPHNGGVTQTFQYPPFQPAPLHIPQPRISTTTQKPFQRDLSNNWRSSLHSIFVANLSRRVTRQGLKDFFDVYGRVRDVFISLKQNPNKTTTFAFVRYKEKWEMERAILQSNGRKLDGYHLMVKKADFGWDQRWKTHFNGHPSVQSKPNTPRNQTNQNPPPQRYRPNSPRDGRTYLEALQNKSPTRPPAQISCAIDID
ncbi:RNA recognition motif domain - like 10 [Theobroma cacao]|nr:RNA recognition motif domain - like 10 [Theobroma cacao]